MNAVPLSSLAPALPEIVLAVGAMALLMVGAYRERSTQLVNLGAIMLLIVAAFIVARVPGGTILNGSFIVDDFARFTEDPDVYRLGLRHRDVAQLSWRPRRRRNSSSRF